MPINKVIVTSALALAVDPAAVQAMPAALVAARTPVPALFDIAMHAQPALQAPAVIVAAGSDGLLEQRPTFINPL